MAHKKRYALVIDSKKCIDCKACVVACRAENNVPLRYSRNWIDEEHRGEWPKLLAAFEAATAQRKLAVIPEYGGKHGHPILIGREMIEVFLKAPTGTTARDVEHQYAEGIEYVPVDDPFITLNVNTPEDYAVLIAGKAV